MPQGTQRRLEVEAIQDAPSSPLLLLHPIGTESLQPSHPTPGLLSTCLLSQPWGLQSCPLLLAARESFLTVCPSLHTTHHGSYPLLRLVVLNWGDFVLQGNVQRSLLLSQWEGGRERFVTGTSEQRPGMLLTILQCTGQSLPQGMTQAQMLVVQS